MKLLILGIHLDRSHISPPAVAIPAGDLHLSALPILDDQPLADRDLLMRAAFIRGGLLEKATFIAARYGFAAATPEEAAARCTQHLSRWKATLVRYQGCVEMTLKVAAAQPKERPDRKDFRSGADYLKALHQTMRGAEVDEAFLAAVNRHLVPLCVASQWDQRDGRSLELAALVRRERLEELRSAAEQLRTTDVPFMFSGPWPLEVFGDADHE